MSDHTHQDDSPEQKAYWVGVAEASKAIDIATALIAIADSLPEADE